MGVVVVVDMSGLLLRVAQPLVGELPGSTQPVIGPHDLRPTTCGSLLSRFEREPS